jgi:hypothetical protein
VWTTGPYEEPPRGINTMKAHISADDLPSPERRAEFQDMIDSLREYARRELNAWERDFLDSIEAQLATHGFLTRGQREKLEELHSGWQRGSLTPQMSPSPLWTAALTAKRAAESAARYAIAKALNRKDID